MSNARKSVAAIVVAVAVAGAFLGFTKSGHRVLYSIGFTSACEGSCD